MRNATFPCIAGNPAASFQQPGMKGTMLTVVMNVPHPESQRAVFDERDKRLRLVLEPFLISEEDEDQHHRCPDRVIGEVPLEETGTGRDVDDTVHCLALPVPPAKFGLARGSRGGI